MKFDWYIVVYIIVDILKIKVNVNWEVKKLKLWEKLMLENCDIVILFF